MSAQNVFTGEDVLLFFSKHSKHVPVRYNPNKNFIFIVYVLLKKLRSERVKQDKKFAVQMSRKY